MLLQLQTLPFTLSEVELRVRPEAASAFTLRFLNERPTRMPPHSKNVMSQMKRRRRLAKIAPQNGPPAADTSDGPTRPRAPNGARVRGRPPCLS